MIAVIDYDAGNVRSMEKALAYLGEEARLSRACDEILSADGIVLPGVGSFGDAMRNLRRFGLVDTIREAVGRGIPFLGVCLGLQLLFDGSDESPEEEGLSILPGRCVRFSDAYGLKIPQMGWNDLAFRGDPELFRGVPEGAYVYFVHSYHAVPEDPSCVSAVTTYGAEVTAAVGKGNVFACQFHPEKSGAVGLSILRNFLSIVRKEGMTC